MDAASILDHIRLQQAGPYGDTVTYARGEATVSLPAVRSRCDRAVMDSDGIAVMEEEEAWAILADELILSEAEITPKNGDTITDSAGAIYDVHDRFDRYLAGTVAETLKLHTTRKVV